MTAKAVCDAGRMDYPEDVADTNIFNERLMLH